MSLAQRLTAFFGKKKGKPFVADLAPAAPFYVIGDIHGCDHLLADLLEIIARDAAGSAAPIVCVGDYIDRGEESAAVLRRLHRLSQDNAPDLICLLGNHEEMMLRFLDNPARNARMWLKNGGLQTLASFKIDGVQKQLVDGNFAAVGAQLEQALGGALVAWLRGLPTMWSSGNATVVHAAADPARSLDDQPKDALIWGHADFFTAPRQDGQWVIHGHTIMDEVRIESGRIGIDTGAFATGRLSAVRVSSAGVQTLVARGGRPV